jgi:outer membrane lipoprotein-sorting protein
MHGNNPPRVLDFFSPLPQNAWTKQVLSAVISARRLPFVGGAEGFFTCFRVPPLLNLMQEFSMTRQSLVYLKLIFLHSLLSLPLVHAAQMETIIQKMEAVYATVMDYQSTVEVTSAGQEGSLTREKFLYTFRKPKQIRIDFEVPHPGTVVIYSNKDGKVRVRPWGAKGIFELHLDPDSFLLRLRSGQRVDQTDLGLLIVRIRESVEKHRRSPVELSESESAVEISVAADNHFRGGVTTRYRFSIDKKTGLPVQVEESSLEGAFERRIRFLDLRTNIGVPDSTFE